jgi:hypothetical protein
MLRRFIISLAAIAALAVTMPGGAFAAGHGGHGHPGHSVGGGRHFGGPGRFVGSRGYHPGYAPGYYYGGGYGYYPPDYGYYYPPDYGYYYEPDYGAAMALGIMSMISGMMASHLYHHHHCWLHHGRRVCR